MVECPHVSISELSRAWNVNKRTVQRWLANEGITTVIRGRYRIVDVERYAEKTGKPKLTKSEVYELKRLEDENKRLKVHLKAAHQILLEIAETAVMAIGGSVNNESGTYRCNNTGSDLIDLRAEGTTLNDH